MILKGGAYFSTEVAGNPNGSLPTIAFTSCPLLETVVGADGILFYYSKSKAVGKVTLDPSIKTISYGAFDGCKQMTELEAMGVTAIYARAFLDCSELAKVTLPALQHTQGNPFWQDCPSSKR
nr:leucine-rich repeat domain-containing protein [Porphyromonas circumdentaria]